MVESDAVELLGLPVAVADQLEVARVQDHGPVAHNLLRGVLRAAHAHHLHHRVDLARRRNMLRLGHEADRELRRPRHIGERVTIV